MMRSMTSVLANSYQAFLRTQLVMRTFNDPLMNQG